MGPWGYRYLVALAVVASVTLVWVFNLSVYPWKYSLFGRYERTRMPEGPPLYSYGLPKTFPIFRWYIYSSGLGIKLPLAGRLFIKAEDMELPRRSSSGVYVLEHRSPEVRSPLIIPSRKLGENLKAAIEGKP